MATVSIQRFLGKCLALLPALLMPALGLWPDAAVSERGPRLQALVAPAQGEDPNNARVIVKYRAGSDLARAAGMAGRAQHASRLSARLALPLADGRPLGPHSQGLRAMGLSSRQLVARLQAQPDVEWAVVDQRRSITGVLPNDPYYAGNQTSITPTVGQWYLRAPDNIQVSAINAEGAWAITTGSSSVTVAVLDTGVRFDHPDLLPAAQGGKLWPGYDFVSDNRTAADGGGRDADASDPGDWSTASSSCGAAPSSWHGTQVAGLVGAASDNGIGMASVGRQVMVLPVRVLGQCGGFDSDIQAGMLWAAGLISDPVPNPHPAKVINISLGSPTACDSYQPIIDQLTAAKVTVVVAAGNSTGLDVNSPANCQGVIAVAGVRHAGTKVGYSSLGPQVSLAAPAGNCVNIDGGPCLYPLLTTVNAGTTSPGANTYSDSTRSSLGTSFAAPLVAGTAALMLSVDPTLAPAQIKAVLQASTRAFPTTGGADAKVVACQAPGSVEQLECYCTTSTCGAGLLDAGAAVARVQLAALAPTAVIQPVAGPVTVGSTVRLDGGASAAAVGRSIVRYQWRVAGGDLAAASLNGATDGNSATLTALSPGTLRVSLTVTDNTGASRSAEATVTVAAAPVVVTPPATGGGGGGGAMGLGWMFGLASAIGLLARRRLSD